MKTKIERLEMYATPNSMNVVEAWINALDKKDRMTGYMIMGMTWNFLVDAFDKQSREENDNVSD